MLSKARLRPIYAGWALCALPSHRHYCWLRRVLRHGGARFMEAQRRASEEIELKNLITHPMREQREVCWSLNRETHIPINPIAYQSSERRESDWKMGNVEKKKTRKSLMSESKTPKLGTILRSWLFNIRFLSLTISPSLPLSNYYLEFLLDSNLQQKLLFFIFGQ